MELKSEIDSKTVIKLLPENYLDYEAVDISAKAFPHLNFLTEQDYAKRKEKVLKMQIATNLKSRSMGVFRDNKLVSYFVMHDYIINLFGNTVPFGGLGHVVVSQLHKKEKIALELVKYFCESYVKAGVNIVGLYPFNPQFYKNMGFGYGSKSYMYKVKPNDIIVPKYSKKNICWVDSRSETDKQDLTDCYNRYFKQRHGMLQRTMWYTENWTFNDLKYKAVGYRKNGILEGYLIYYADVKTMLTNTELVVREIVYENHDALNELLSFLKSESDQFQNVVFTLAEEHFHFLFNDCRLGNVFYFVAHEIALSAISIMYRIVNTQAFFKTLSTHDFNGQDLKLKINITDTLLQQNNGSLIIHFKQGLPHIADNSDFEVEISLDISEFSSLVMGSVDFRSLERFGKVTISDQKYITKLNRLFAVDDKPITLLCF